MPDTSHREPWMRGDHHELDALRRGVVHALLQAGEDAERWAAPLSEAEFFARPVDLPSVAFHLRHIVRSLDRLLTYAEDRALNPHQLAALSTEMDAGSRADVLAEFRSGLIAAMDRVLAFNPADYEQPRGIGRQRLPTTLGGLLVHAAEHTQRHTGQMITTAKIARASILLENRKSKEQ